MPHPLEPSDATSPSDPTQPDAAARASDGPQQTQPAPCEPKPSVIPRRFVQIYVGADLPTSLQDNLSHNLRLADGWAHELFTDRDLLPYVSRHFGGEMRARLERISPDYGAARADLFRYLTLYSEGGFYLDVKSTLTRQLDSIIRADDSYLLGTWHDCGEKQYGRFGRDKTILNPEGEFQQWFIFAAPRHPFLKAVIKEVCRRIDIYSSRFHGTGRWGTLNTTGPIPYTNAIYPLLRQHRHRRISSFTDLGLRYSMFDAPDQHYQLMPKHYTLNIGPVVVHSPITATKNFLLASFFAVGRRIAPG